MKLQIAPPQKKNARYRYIATDFSIFASAWGVVIDVGGRYRGHRALALECQRDLLRYAAIHGGLIIPGLADARAPFIYFERTMVKAWLEAGGRTWIIAELEARSSRRVVPFESKGGAA